MTDHNVTAKVVEGHIEIMFGSRVEYWPIDLAQAIADAISDTIAGLEEQMPLYQNKTFSGEVEFSLWPKTEKALNYLKEHGEAFGHLSHITYGDGGSYGGGMWKLTLRPGIDAEKVRRALKTLGEES